MSERAAKKTRSQQAEMQSYVFDIKRWEPVYSWSINQDKFRLSPYHEHLAIDLEGACIFPAEYTGRVVQFSLMAEREALTPAVFKDDQEWRPRCVGYLEMKPGRGHFYMSFPHESFISVLTCLGQESLRFIDVYGPKLKRSRSYCSSFRLMSSFDLEDY